MSDEDSKFSFSERTRVDEGDASGGEEDPTPQDVERPGDDEGGDLAGKTGVLSSITTEMRSLMTTMSVRLRPRS